MEEQKIEGQKKNNSWLIGGIIVLVLAIASYGVFKYTTKESVAEVPVETPVVTPPVTTPVTPSTVVTSSYKDGVYPAIGEYESPGGMEQIAVVITLKNDVITDAVVDSKATRPNSKKFQGIFISNFKPFVVGRNISEVQLDKVSGSSLTPLGFNDALDKIKAQAHV